MAPLSDDAMKWYAAHTCGPRCAFCGEWFAGNDAYDTLAHHYGDEHRAEMNERELRGLVSVLVGG